MSAVRGGDRGSTQLGPVLLQRAPTEGDWATQTSLRSVARNGLLAVHQGLGSYWGATELCGR
jgi:hypothetical protein